MSYHIVDVSFKMIFFISPLIRRLKNIAIDIFPSSVSFYNLPFCIFITLLLSIYLVGTENITEMKSLSSHLLAVTKQRARKYLDKDYMYWRRDAEAS